ncbi:MAG: head GIN domain-containing protein [Bacteroidia bacterium]
MLRRITISVILLSYLFLFNSCKKQNMCDCFKPRGETVTDTRIVPAFTILDVYDKIDVYYTQDTTASSYTVKVMTGKNLLSSISTVVSGGVLQIRDGNRCNFVRGSHNEVTVFVTTPFVGKIIQDGVGTIYSANTIKQDTLSYQIKNSGDIHLNVNIQSFMNGSMYGAGDVYLTGTAQNHQVWAAGECFVNAQNLQTGYTLIEYSSTGEAHINVSGWLDYDIMYHGNIYYNGNPSVKRKIGECNGSGELINI